MKRGVVGRMRMEMEKRYRRDLILKRIGGKRCKRSGC